MVIDDGSVDSEGHADMANAGQKKWQATTGFDRLRAS